MTRLALTLATLATLTLNGAQVSATESACNDRGVCALSLRMLTPPPPRPAHIHAPVQAESTTEAQADTPRVATVHS